MNVRDEFQPTAIEMLAEFGAPATLVRTSAARDSYDAVTDRTTLVPGAETRLTVQTVVLDLEWADEQGIEVTRATALMIEKPVQGDRLLQGDMEYSVGLVRVTAPQGQAVLYEAQVS